MYNSLTDVYNRKCHTLTEIVLDQDLILFEKLNIKKLKQSLKVLNQRLNFVQNKEKTFTYKSYILLLDPMIMDISNMCLNRLTWLKNNLFLAFKDLTKSLLVKIQKERSILDA